MAVSQVFNQQGLAQAPRLPVEVDPTVSSWETVVFGKTRREACFQVDTRGGLKKCLLPVMVAGPTPHAAARALLRSPCRRHRTPIGRCQGCSASCSTSPTDWYHAFLTAAQLVVFTKASFISERLGDDEWWQGGPGLQSGQGLQVEVSRACLLPREERDPVVVACLCAVGS